MRMAWVALSVVVGVAIAARAAEEKGPAKTERFAGKVIEATLDGDKVVWRVATEKDGDRAVAVEMKAAVTILYREKDGQKEAFLLGVGGKAPTPRPDRLVAQGKFVKAEAKESGLTLTFKVGEGDAAADQAFQMPGQLAFFVRQEGDRLVASMVGTYNIQVGGPSKQEEK